MTKYPNDEFDRVPEFTNRKGVHRQAVAGEAARRSPLGWIVAFGILALVVGLFSYFVLPQLTGQPVATTAAASSSASAPASPTQDDADASSASEAPSGGASEGAAASDEAGASESEAAESSRAAEESAAASEAAASSSAAAASSAAAESSAAAAEPDLSTSIGVYNASNRSGLAGSGRSELVGAGFTSVSAGNWTKHVNNSVVYYKSEADKATAQQAADVLGIGTIYQTANIPGRIAVVLGSGY
ncbi:LytR C-terminal domain-containing protein [Arthrobacter sp. JSM 101049]|uniref:LytR C-terminal domain-containing protein n=1 Tax=Arthrobacter sp. JSM 101049 TaxID=929097 RepID=UPI003569E695